MKRKSKKQTIKGHVIIGDDKVFEVILGELNNEVTLYNVLRKVVGGKHVKGNIVKAVPCDITFEK